MRQKEQGNVFFYILICVVLLAALSYAIAQGGRTSASTLSKDTNNLLASEIISYADTITKAVAQLRLRGTTLNTLSFANEFLPAGDYGTYNADPGNEVFNTNGGAVVYKDPPAKATTSGSESWLFIAGNEIENIGSTCAGAGCSDLIMAIPNVQESVCIQINDLLGVGTAGAVPPDDSDFDDSVTFKPIAVPASPFAYNETIGDEDTALSGQSEACYNENGTRYVYYKTLLPR